MKNAHPSQTVHWGALLYAKMPNSKVCIWTHSEPAHLGMPSCFRETSDQNISRNKKILKFNLREGVFHAKNPKFSKKSSLHNIKCS